MSLPSGRFFFSQFLKNRSKNRRKIAENFSKIGVLLHQNLEKSVDFLTLHRYPIVQNLRRFFSSTRVYKLIKKKGEYEVLRKIGENDLKNRRKIAHEILKNRYFIGENSSKIGGKNHVDMISYCTKFTPIFLFTINV